MQQTESTSNDVRMLNDGSMCTRRAWGVAAYPRSKDVKGACQVWGAGITGPGNHARCVIVPIACQSGC